jgi:aspartyl-tRNA(Asn)/glutamyl-tRNA(Gln) amidotransferase subunit C
MINKKDIEYVAKLAKLKLTEEEKEKLTPQMGDIINFANKISELNTEGINPTAHILEINNVFREDEVNESYNRDDIIKNAPVKEAGCIIVPGVNN